MISPPLLTASSGFAPARRGFRRGRSTLIMMAIARRMGCSAITSSSLGVWGGARESEENARRNLLSDGWPVASPSGVAKRCRLPDWSGSCKRERGDECGSCGSADRARAGAGGMVLHAVHARRVACSATPSGTCESCHRAPGMHRSRRPTCFPHRTPRHAR